ncbi:hypothetical protein A2U01_0067236, partial [Trifolium medium]|nr:hypothetical protein [Trifolium medium]
MVSPKETIPDTVMTSNKEDDFDDGRTITEILNDKENIKATEEKDQTVVDNDQNMGEKEEEGKVT